MELNWTSEVFIEIMVSTLFIITSALTYFELRTKKIRIIRIGKNSKKQPLLLSGKYTKIPLELDNRLKEILGEGDEYEHIRAEILKSPIYLISDFLSLYDVLQEEMNQISDVEQKSLDIKFNNEI